MDNKIVNPFNKSNVVQRTPPGGDTNNESVSCGLCRMPDNMEMVASDKCEIWYHFSCVNVTEEISSVEWICEKCSEVVNSKERSTATIIMETGLATPKPVDSIPSERDLANVESHVQGVALSSVNTSNLPVLNLQNNAISGQYLSSEKTLDVSESVNKSIGHIGRTPSNSNIVSHLERPLEGSSSDLGTRFRSPGQSILQGNASILSSQRFPFGGNLINSDLSPFIRTSSNHHLSGAITTAVPSQTFSHDEKANNSKIPVTSVQSSLRNPDSTLASSSLSKKAPKSVPFGGTIFGPCFTGQNALQLPYTSGNTPCLQYGAKSASSGLLPVINKVKQLSVNPSIPSRLNEVEASSSHARSKKRSVTSGSSVSKSSSTRGQLALKKLREEKELQLAKLRIEEEYINKKYSLLEDIASSRGSERDNSRISTESRQRTEQWVLTQSTKPEETNPLNTKAESKASQAPPISVKNRESRRKSDDNIESAKNEDLLYITPGQMAARMVISKNLPIFDGQPREWPMFISSYESSTRSCALTNAENLDRLKHSLKGMAMKAVQGSLLLPEKVPQVIATLEMLFGKPEQIVQDLVEEAEMEANLMDDDLSRFISFALKVQNMCSTMEATGLHDHLNNPDLLRKLVEKLPTGPKMIWGEYKRNFTAVNLGVFSDWLMQRAGIATDFAGPCTKIPKKADTGHTRKPKQSSGYLHAAHSLKARSDSTSTNSTSASAAIFVCRVCQKKGHMPDDCPQFISYRRTKRWHMVKILKLCNCCLGYHVIRNCEKIKICNINGCTQRHHPLLHKIELQKPTTSIEQPTEVVATVSLNTYQPKKCNVLFRIIPILLHSNAGSVSTYAFLDEGSSLTLLEDSIANSLKLDGSPESLCLKWTGNTTRKETKSRRVSLSVSGINIGSPKFQISDVRTVSQLNLPIQSVKELRDESEHKHLRNLPISWYENAVPTILIGLQHWQLCLPLEVREGQWGEPVATKTRLGWTISGPLHNLTKADDYVNFHLCDCSQKEDLHQLVKDFFSTESLGVKIPGKLLESRDDERARKILETSLVRRGPRFETSLLWRYDKIILPNSRLMAERRLDCLDKKMKKDPALAKKLEGIIEEYISLSYIRKLSKTEEQVMTPKTWYLPIFAVSNPNKPQKIRIVWDAAATVNGVSLNNMLLKGPDLLTSLPNILYKFRERKVTVCGDIKHMFHQVAVNTEDQQSQRFLWRSNDLIESYVMKVMTFGASCSPCIAQYAKNKNASEYSDQFPRASMAIQERHYVDDWLDSFDSEEEAIATAKEVKFIHSKGGFHIRNWMSNSTAVLSELGEEKCQEAKNLMFSSDAIDSTKILGMWWNASADHFYYVIRYDRIGTDILSERRKPTKREVLRTLMLIYDPLDLIAFYLVYGKMLLQEIWRSSVDWDETIHDRQVSKWQKWTQLLPALENIKVPRSYISTESTPEENYIELHVFVDSSDSAFAAVAYFRIISGNAITTRLVGAKTKVAPRNPPSIPRLELQAAVLGARLGNSLMSGHSIKIARRFFWSDSMDVLYWLRSENRKFQQFVSHRVGEILDSTDLREWRWVPTKLNVADDATKWKNEPEVSSTSRWFAGPPFLCKPESEWPVEKHSQIPADLPEEVRQIFHHQSDDVFAVPDQTRCSKWKRLVNAQAYVLRVFDRLKKRRVNWSGAFTVHEIETAEYELYRSAQRDEYGDEISLLLRNGKIPKSSTIYKLSPFLDGNQILRMRGRLQNADYIPFDTRNPIILPKKHRITMMIIDYYHQQFLHGNNETVVNELRQKFSIPKLRTAVKSIVHCCQRCKNVNAKPNIPEMASLPKARLSSFSRPFSYVGVDYFGPMEVAVGRRIEKRWGALFTCMTVRAVHTEVAHSLSTDSFIMAFRNFISRRGTPIEMFSDNGTNFRGTCTELKEFVTTELEPKLQNGFPIIKWNFVPPSCPHMGGAWERLVRSIKTNLSVVLPSRRPSDELLKCCLAEIDNVVNSRPLTYIPIESHTNEALTPNHFLLGSSSGMKLLGEFDDDVLIQRKNWKISQKITQQFWQRWIKEYMPTISRRTKWFEKAKPIAVGDVVLIMDDLKPNSWTKGMVKEVKLSSDGQVRQVLVRTSTGDFVRPSAKVAVLDLAVESKTPS